MTDLDAPIPPEQAMVNAAQPPLPQIAVVRHHPVTQDAVDRECDALQALALRCDQRGDGDGYRAAHGAAELIGLLWHKSHGDDRQLDRRIRDIVRAELAKPGACGSLR